MVSGGLKFTLQFPLNCLYILWDSRSNVSRYNSAKFFLKNFPHPYDYITKYNILYGDRTRTPKISSRNISHEYSGHNENDSKYRTKPYSIKKYALFSPPLDPTACWEKVTRFRLFFFNAYITWSS